ncbi:MAG: GntR family transcriptional regulator [Candidatus Caldatribacteriota bacterium]|nr:GntR family transcriptional regulator [Candidatus Caldatribacteriota bacterium]
MENISKIEGYELLSQKVYRVLKMEIVKGAIKPGAKLLEGKIAEQMGISRTPVREALRELAAEGFVKMNPNQGMIVNNASIEDVHNVLQIRGVLEGLAARLAATLISKEETKKLDSYIKQMEKFTDRNDPLAFSDIDAKFHELIVNCCGNKQLIQIRKNISEQVNRYRIKSLNVPGRLKYSLKEHQEIAEALKIKDSKKADMLSRKHIESAMENFLSHMIGKEEDKNQNAWN